MQEKPAGARLVVLRYCSDAAATAMELIEPAEGEIKRLSQLTRRTLAPHRETTLPMVTKLSAILDGVCSLFQPQFPAAGIEVRRDYQTEGEVTIYAGDLRQVLNNPISNAIDAMERKKRLELSVENPAADTVQVTVRDTGCGIPAEGLGVIFKVLHN